MTDELDLGSLVYDGGFFLVREKASPPEPFTSGDVDAGRSYRHIFTYTGSGNTIKKTALELIRSARDKVFVASFLLGEADLLDALFDTAERLRGGVYVISELSDKSLQQKLTELEDSPDPDSAIRAHKKNFAELTRHGVAVRGHPDCHAKFIVVDDRAALVSSANLDTNGLNNTGENGTVVTDPIEVERLARFYTRLWDSSAYEMPAGSDDYSVREHTPCPSRCHVPLPETVAPGIIWTYGEEQLIWEHMHDVIRRARQTLLLATFSLNHLTSHRDLLLDPLQRAIRDHSLRVWLLCRGRNNVRSQRDDAAALHDLGVHIYADSVNHAKGVIADSQYGALFSANFDAAHGLLDGVETGIRLDGQPALAEAERFFGHAMANADLEFARRPTQRQMDERLAIRWRTAWPFEARMRITTSPESWQRFRAAAKAPPVLYSREPRGRVRLYAAEGQWLLSGPQADGKRTLELAQSGPSWAAEKAPQNSAGLLEYWLSPPRWHSAKNEKAPQRGLCPAILAHG
jgi:phosphatidylserine/phosphatidylglycerophosphate/cardiolipin synthase-like enzyme